MFLLRVTPLILGSTSPVKIDVHSNEGSSHIYLLVSTCFNKLCFLFMFLPQNFFGKSADIPMSVNKNKGVNVKWLTVVGMQTCCLSVAESRQLEGLWLDSVDCLSAQPI